MALSDDELGPDEVDLVAKSGTNWKKTREYWNKYLDEWEKEIYYPVFAQRGISKGHALTTYVVKTETVDIYNLMVMIRNDDKKEDDEGGDTWKQDQD